MPPTPRPSVWREFSPLARAPARAAKPGQESVGWPVWCIPLRFEGLAPHPRAHHLAPPTRLAQAYADAGYFARNVRTVEVLIDREAVQSGDVPGGTSRRWA